MRINPYFSADGITYTIRPSRILDAKYEELQNNSILTIEEQELYVDYQKLQEEYKEFAERFVNAKSEYLDDILNKEKKEKYKAFEEITNEKFNEIKRFALNPELNKVLTKVENIAYENGVEILITALTTQYKEQGITIDKAKELWNGFVEELGLDTAKQWILFMAKNLFEEEENTDPFLTKAKEKEIQRMEKLKGLSKIKR